MRARGWMVIAAASGAWLSADGLAAAENSSALLSWARKSVRSNDYDTRLRAYRQLWELGIRVAMPQRKGACHEIEASDPSTCRERLRVCLSSEFDVANNVSWQATLTPVPSTTRSISADVEQELVVPLRVDAWISSKSCSYAWGFGGDQAPELLSRCVATGRSQEACQSTIRWQLEPPSDPHDEDPGKAAVGSVPPFRLTWLEKRRAERERRQCLRELARDEALNSGPLCHVVSVDPCRGWLGVVCKERLLDEDGVEGPLELGCRRAVVRLGRAARARRRRALTTSTRISPAGRDAGTAAAAELASLARK